MTILHYALAVLGALLLGTIASLAAAEIYSWLPTLSRRLVRWHASSLRNESAEPMMGELNARLDAIPGSISKLAFAVALFGTARYRGATPGTARRFSRSIHRAISILMCLVLALVQATVLFALGSILTWYDEWILGPRPFTAWMRTVVAILAVVSFAFNFVGMMVTNRRATASMVQ